MSPSSSTEALGVKTSFTTDQFTEELVAYRPFKEELVGYRLFKEEFFVEGSLRVERLKKIHKVERRQQTVFLHFSRLLEDGRQVDREWDRFVYRGRCRGQ
jgi:hypothetical protein